MGSPHLSLVLFLFCSCTIYLTEQRLCPNFGFCFVIFSFCEGAFVLLASRQLGNILLPLCQDGVNACNFVSLTLSWRNFFLLSRLYIKLLINMLRASLIGAHLLIPWLIDWSVVKKQGSGFSVAVSADICPTFSNRFDFFFPNKELSLTPLNVFDMFWHRFYFCLHACLQHCGTRKPCQRCKMMRPVKIHATDALTKCSINAATV